MRIPWHERGPFHGSSLRPRESEEDRADLRIPHGVASASMRCPLCLTEDTRVIDSRPAEGGTAIRRRRECSICGERFTTFERSAQEATVIKRDGRREEFDAEKLKSGLRIACARRPISAAAIERIVERVEYAIRQTGRTEVASRLIGDIAIEELRKLDEVAYIRYAIVYLGLEDLESIRAEIDQLRAQRH